MEGKTVVNMRMVIEETKDQDRLARVGYYGERINLEHLVLDFLLAIDELVHESTNLKIEDVKQKKQRGKIVVDLQIAAEDTEGLVELSNEDVERINVMQAAHISST